MRLHPLAAALAAFTLVVPGIAAADKQLDEVVVGDRHDGQIEPRLRNEIIATESFGARAIERSGGGNVNEVLDKNPGIAVQVECSICNVRNVLLNNLPGRYTTVLIDGIPIYSSVSSAYGLDSIGVDGLERIDVSRGAGSSLIAPEALSGVVNLITKRPIEAETRATLLGGEYGALRADGYLARPFDGGAWSLTLHHNEHETVDVDGNRISEYSGFKRNIAGLGLFLDDVGGFRIKARLDAVQEDRGGGALGYNYGKIKASTSGNPFDFRKGPNGSPHADGWDAPDGSGFLPYDDGLGGFSEIIFTDRIQGTVSAERQLGDGKLRLAAAYARHEQDSYYEKDIYKAKQDQYYLETSYILPVGEWLLTGGLNYRYEDLRSTGLGQAGTVSNDGIDDYEYRAPGLFVQAYRAFFDDRLEANGSVRWDKHNAFGTIVSPRLNLLWHHDETLNSRFAVGKGFRAPTSFFEQDHGILNTLRIVREIDEPETSENLSYALSYADERLAWVTSWNWNRIKNMALLDPDAVDGAGNPVTLFTSADRPVYVSGIDATMTYKFTGQLAGTIAAEHYKYRFDPGTLVFARPETRAYLMLDYDSGPWSLSTKATWTGPQDLAKFYDYANTPRYNFDGTPKKDKSPSYWTLDVRAQYAVNKTVSLILGADNLFDYTQAEHENFLWIDDAGSYDVTQIWGPSRGRYVYAGVKIAL